MKKSYWNGNGKYQDIVEQIQKGIIVLDNKDQKEYDKLTRQYYKYHNNGDLHYTLRNKAYNNNLTVEQQLEYDVDRFLLRIKIKYTNK